MSLIVSRERFGRMKDASMETEGESVRTAGLMIYRQRGNSHLSPHSSPQISSPLTDQDSIPQWLLLQSNYAPFRWSPPRGNIDQTMGWFDIYYLNHNWPQVQWSLGRTILVGPWGRWWRRLVLPSIISSYLKILKSNSSIRNYKQIFIFNEFQKIWHLFNALLFFF